MLQLLRKYRTVLKFILIFLGTYVILSSVYSWYLSSFSSEIYYPDYVTHLVARQSQALISSMGYDVVINPAMGFPSMDLRINGRFVARIIEGCNSISIIILFISFMLAFFGKVKSTLIYLFSGAVLIYAINLVRIAVLSVGIYEIPRYGHFFHEVIFPLIIYGTVFILWLLWIRIYSKQMRQ
ncbi:exosortase family protein XrtF [Salinimicrobium sp. GXAS 041]|uniref:exosortase family protein XrtF n=1 Tax=Salinimicrobium sp. GXAS 041 TaxID=3400806 RepID=UPI003C78AEF7